MDLKIYNEKAQIVYNQNRKAFWNTEDAYKNTLEYLIKRSPLYTK
jgi:alpha-amylase/alpha-mannosidase (GH57 family)